jgi:hypothetical protein
MLLTPEERVQKALQLFDLMEKFVERARNPVGGEADRRAVRAGGCLFVVRSTARVGQEEPAEACCGATKKAVAVRFDGGQSPPRS